MKLPPAGWARTRWALIAERFEIRQPQRVCLAANFGLGLFEFDSARGRRFSIDNSLMASLESRRERPTMQQDAGVARRQVKIVNTYGLHMRPSSKFAKLANSFQSDIRVHFQGTTVNGKSLLEMTTLAAECGATLELVAKGTDAEKALDALAELVAAGFHMEEENA